MTSLTGVPPNGPNKYLGPTTAYPVVVTRNRTPTTADYRQPETGRLYPITAIWQVGKNPTDGEEGDLWMLSKIVANQAYWVLISNGGSGPINDFTVDVRDDNILAGDIRTPSDVIVEPVDGVVRIAGDNGIKSVSSINAPGVATVRFIRGDVQTENVQTLTALTQAIPILSTFSTQILVAAYSNDNFAFGAYGTCVVKNASSVAPGTAVLINTVDLITNKETGLNAAKVVVDVTGADMRVRVTGVAGKKINWTVIFPGSVLSNDFPF